MKIKNNYTGPLAIAGVEIAPGATRDVPKWDAVKGSTTVELWLKTKVIEAEKPKAEKTGKTDKAAADKAAADKAAADKAAADKEAEHDI